MSGSGQGVELVRTGTTARITLNPPPLNILDLVTLQTLAQTLESLPPPPDLRFVVFAGAGSRAFSAGVDVRDHLDDRVAGMLQTFHRVFRLLWRSDWISLAVVRGHCLGGGMELATFCDFVLAAETARFGQPEIKLGCFPPVAAVILARLSGPKRALDLLLRGRTLSAKEAFEMGLLTRVVPEGELEAATDDLLAELSQFSSAAQVLTKKAMWRGQGFDFEGALEESEQIYLNVLMKTQDAQEGLKAFLEKRQPVWIGR